MLLVGQTSEGRSVCHLPTVDWPHFASLNICYHAYVHLSYRGTGPLHCLEKNYETTLVRYKTIVATPQKRGGLRAVVALNFKTNRAIELIYN